MPKTSTPKTRHHSISDMDRHLEEWMDTLEELRDLTEDDLDVLMQLTSNDNETNPLD